MGKTVRINFRNDVVVSFDRVNRCTGLANYFTATSTCVIDVIVLANKVCPPVFFLTVRRSCGSLFTYDF